MGPVLNFVQVSLEVLSWSVMDGIFKLWSFMCRCAEYHKICTFCSFWNGTCICTWNSYWCELNEYLPVIYCQHWGCWWPGNTRNQGITTNSIDWVQFHTILLEFCCFSMISRDEAIIGSVQIMAEHIEDDCHGSHCAHDIFKLIFMYENCCV